MPPSASDYSAPRWGNKLGTQTFSLKPFTNIEVFNALCSINPKKSTGADQLELSLLFLVAPFLVDYLTHIFNLTVITGSISDIWKMLFNYVQPLHKRVQSNEVHNF